MTILPVVSCLVCIVSDFSLSLPLYPLISISGGKENCTSSDLGQAIRGKGMSNFCISIKIL